MTEQERYDSLIQRMDEGINRARSLAHDEYRAGVTDAIDHANFWIKQLEKMKREIRLPGETGAERLARIGRVIA